MQNVDITIQNKIKEIVVNSKLNTKVNVEDAVYLIKAYILEKTGTDIFEKEFDYQNANLNALMAAFEIAMEYFEKTYHLLIILKPNKHFPDQLTLIKAWF